MAEVHAPSTTVDFGPLLALRAEYHQSGGDLITRIEAGDLQALELGKELVAREACIERELQAQLAAMYDHISRYAHEDERRAAEGFAHVLDAIRATEDLYTAVSARTMADPPPAARPAALVSARQARHADRNGPVQRSATR